MQLSLVQMYTTVHRQDSADKNSELILPEELWTRRHGCLGTLHNHPGEEAIPTLLRLLEAVC